MVILDADLGRAVHRPAKGDAPLVVDANGVEPAPLALQGFEPVARRNGHVAKLPGLVELDQFPQRDAGEGRKPAVSLFVEELLGIAIGK